MRSLLNGDQVMAARMEVIRSAERCGNVSKVCREYRISRTTFYTLKRAYETYGAEGLIPRERRFAPPKNKHSAATEAVVLDLTRAYPTESYRRIARRAREQGTKISDSSVQNLWSRMNLTTQSSRLTWAQEGQQPVT